MPLYISGASQANPCVITTSKAHGLVNGDEVYIDGVSGMTSLNGRYYTVGAVPSATTFELMGINSSGYTAYSSGGVVQRVVGELNDWEYQYFLPADALRILDLSVDDGPYDWQVEDNMLVTDAGPTVSVRYIQKKTDTTAFDPLLINALTARLAAELAIALTNNNSHYQQAIANYMGFLEEAKMNDLREQSPTMIDEDSWLRSRN